MSLHREAFMPPTNKQGRQYVLRNAQGAGFATLLTICFQTWHTVTRMLYHMTPERMPATTNHCPGNMTLASEYLNGTFILLANRNQPFVLAQMSSNWSSVFVLLLTVIMGLLFSWGTGKNKLQFTFQHISCCC